MRIGIVAQRFDPRHGGLEQWTVAFARYLLARGHAVDVVAFGGETEGLPVRLHRLTAPRGEAAQATALDAALAALPVDVVFDTGLSRSGDVYQPQTGSRLGSLDREIATFGPLRRLKAAVSPRTQRRRWQLRRLEQIQIRRAHRIVAVSDRVQALLVEADPTAADRLVVLRNGTDLSRFTPGRLAGRRASRRAALGIAPDTLLITSLAHNLRLKGVETTMRALALLPQSCRVRFAIAGGRLDMHLRRLIGACGLTSVVHELGWIDDVDGLLAATDAFVHPSRWDACSVSTVEALAAGLPVITTRMDGAADYITEGVSGHILARPDDHRTLSDLLIRLCDPDHRNRLAAGARAIHDRLGQDYASLEALLTEAAECRRRAPQGRHSRTM